MTTKTTFSFLVAILCVVAVLLVGEQVKVAVAVAVNCNPIELTPCIPAITLGSAPSTACCTKLKEQEPCLCGYIKDPTFGKYVDSPGAKKTATSCGVPIPAC